MLKLVRFELKISLKADLISFKSENIPKIKIKKENKINDSTS